MNEFGVDIAFDVRLTQAMLSELDFAIPRIGTFGYSQIGSTAYYSKPLLVDSGFQPNIELLAANSKFYGCYIFSYAWDIASAEAEANAVCDKLDEYGYALNLPVFFDWERTGEGTYGSYEMVTAAGITVTPQLVRGMAKAFMDVCASRGRRAGWYQSAGDLAEWWGRRIVREFRETDGYYLWVAQWAATTEWAENADLWQYEGDVQWNGIDVDKNKAISDRLFDGQPVPRKRKGMPVWMMCRPFF